jgi:hypothetical protein
MGWSDWVPAITTTSLLGAALWFLRSWIATRLTQSVQHEYDKKLETLRTGFRQSEELFKAELRSKEAQIEALRSGALTGLASRQAALDKRRIEAVDQLWSTVIALGSLKGASATLSAINFAAASKIASENPKVREAFAIIAEPFDIKKIDFSPASKARPFVSVIAWALFFAYQAIVVFAVLRLHMLKAGIDAPQVLNPDSVVDLIKAALPDAADTVAKSGLNEKSLYFLLDVLEIRLLEELKKTLQGDESDLATVEQAAAILKKSERLMVSITQSSQESAQ